MKLTADFAGESHGIDFRSEDGRVAATIDGRRYEVAASRVEHGVYLLINDGRVYECVVERNPAQQGTVEVHVGGRSFSLALSDPKRLRTGHGAGAHAMDGTIRITAPMPGKVVRVLAEAGAAVEAGEGIIVVEAMKMQNELKSPRAGTVSEIRAAAGSTVNAGDVLAVIE